MELSRSTSRPPRRPTSSASPKSLERRIIDAVSSPPPEKADKIPSSRPDGWATASTFDALRVAGVLDNIQLSDVALLCESIDRSSPSERAHSVAVARVAENLHEWHAELRDWKWPARRNQETGLAFLRSRTTPISRNSAPTSSLKRKEYLGSLPKSVVLQHEQRIAEIKARLHDLPVGALGRDRRNGHRPDGNESDPALPVRFDLAAVTDRALHQARLYLPKTHTLLGDWEARIMVLKQVPEFLKLLEAVETWSSTMVTQPSTGESASRPGHAHLAATEGSFCSQVDTLRAKLERMLARLRGRYDALPPEWIQRVDALQAKSAAGLVTTEESTPPPCPLTSRGGRVSRSKAASFTRPQLIHIPPRRLWPDRQVRSLDLGRPFGPGEPPPLSGQEMTAAGRKKAARATIPAFPGTLEHATSAWANEYQHRLHAQGVNATESVADPVSQSGAGVHDDKSSGSVDGHAASNEASSTRRAPGDDVQATLESVSKALCRHQDLTQALEGGHPGQQRDRRQLLTVDCGPFQLRRKSSEISLAASMQSDALSGISTPEVFEATTVEATQGPGGSRLWVQTSPDSGSAPANLPIVPPRRDTTRADVELRGHQRPQAGSTLPKRGAPPTKQNDSVSLTILTPSPTGVSDARYSADSLGKHLATGITITRRDSVSSSLTSPVSSLDSGDASLRPDSDMSPSPLEDVPRLSLSVEPSPTEEFAQDVSQQAAGPLHLPRRSSRRPGPDPGAGSDARCPCPGRRERSVPRDGGIGGMHAYNGSDDETIDTMRLTPSSGRRRANVRPFGETIVSDMPGPPLLFETCPALHSATDRGDEASRSLASTSALSGAVDDDSSLLPGEDSAPAFSGPANEAAVPARGDGGDADTSTAGIDESALDLMLPSLKRGSYRVGVADVAVKVGPSSPWRPEEWSNGLRSGKVGTVGAVGGIRRIFLSRRAVT